jgi:hypothetical protein
MKAGDGRRDAEKTLERDFEFTGRGGAGRIWAYFSMRSLHADP